MAKVLITTVPFGKEDRYPLDILESSGVEYTINPLNRKLTEEELVDQVGDAEVIIAGTEPITEQVMAAANKLRHISRVGIGLDSVDLLAAERRGIMVSYTPDAPSPAVADLTIGLMISLLRSVHIANDSMHNGRWQRYFGRRLGDVTIGIIGVGRIGTRVIRRLKGFNCPKILSNDLNPNQSFGDSYGLVWTSKKDIYRHADIISLHVPLTSKTRNMISQQDLLSMKPDALLINTSRGGIVNEEDLFNVMSNGHLCGAAMDVFEQEPYEGPLRGIERCLLTSHMGSMTVDCRLKMEREATEEAMRFIAGETLKSKVPDEEYLAQREEII